jgi:hypothetical protein
MRDEVFVVHGSNIAIGKTAIVMGGADEAVKI